MIIIKAVKNGFTIPPELYHSDMPEVFQQNWKRTNATQRR